MGSARPDSCASRAVGETRLRRCGCCPDIIQNKFDYTINWVQLIIMAIVLIGYFVFLFRASDQEYKEVIDEKFNGKK